MAEGSTPPNAPPPSWYKCGAPRRRPGRQSRDVPAYLLPSMSVSLWCEEADEEQSQNRSSVPVQSGPPGSSRLRAGWDPSASGRRVIQRLLQVEERYTPPLLYVSLIQQEPRRREELAHWALEVRQGLAGPLRPAPALTPSRFSAACCRCAARAAAARPSSPWPSP